MDYSQNSKTQTETRPIIEVDFNNYQFPIYVDSRTKQTVDMQIFFKDLIGRNSPFENIKEMLESFEDCFDFILQNLDYENFANHKNTSTLMHYLISLKHAFAKMGGLRKYYFD